MELLMPRLGIYLLVAVGLAAMAQAMLGPTSYF
jgi:hypothetical protein